MLIILTDTFSAANQFLYEMRHKDIQNNRGRFRNNMKRLGWAMAFKISEDLSRTKTQIETPLGIKETEVMSESPVLITILRAGNPFLQGFEDVFDSSDIGFIGAFRLESGVNTPEIEMTYRAIPETTGKTVLLIDPMLATGQSMIDAYGMISSTGLPAKIIFVAAVAAPEGVEYVKQNCTIPFEIWTGSLDEKLNEHAYIVPGLGDAGDLSYGQKI